jgi:hypothetical protein
VTHLVYLLAAALDYEIPADRKGNHGTQSLRWIQQQLCANVTASMSADFAFIMSD